ncbi:LysE family translocator [Henriciella sp. AS95]|uniref:LysE family translocator n=1 Tax=Henriciella sp. AS95 TaxID=3135782 RepID=UPI0031704E16
MTFADLAPFLIASIAIELTPGPNMFYIALLSAQNGRLAGLAASAGVALGLLIIGLLAAFGFSAIIAEHRLAYETLRWAGVAYLLWLAWDTWRDTALEAAPARSGPIMSESFTRGLITNLLNPKAFLFYITVLPSFIPDKDSGPADAIVLTLSYVAVATVVHLAIVGGASSVTGYLDNSERRRRTGQLFAIMLVGVAVWVAIKTAV